MTEQKMKLPGKIFTESELQDLAVKNLNEDPKRRDADVKHIKSWIKQQPHLDKYVRQDDEFILHFLRGTKFSLEKTKEKLENWNTIRNLCPEFFTNWDPKAAKNAELLKCGVCIPLKGYDKHGRKVVIQRFGKVDAHKFNMEDCFKISLMINQALIKE